MFEQSLYKQEPVEKVETHEGDLFHDYEIKSWELSPHLYKILAISAALNVLAILVVAQTSLLTMKGCDSPLVGRVCQVLDTMYMGSMLFGTEREYADAAYEKTDLADADITFVDVSGLEGPIDYPTSFVDMNTGEAVSMFPQAPTFDSMAAFSDPGITMMPPDPQNNLLNTAPIPPPNNPNAVTGSIPDSPIATSPNDQVAKNVRPGKVRTPRGNITKSPEKLPEIDGDENKKDGETAEAPDVATPNADGIYINKRPMKDMAKEALAKLDAKAVSLDKPFKVVISGTLGLGKDGKTIVLKNPQVVRAKDDPKNDPAIEQLAKDAIISVGDAGWFGYLDKLKSKKVIVSVEQNDSNFTAAVRADQPSENDARSAASGMSVILTAGSLVAKGDDLTFLRSIKATSEGNAFLLNFAFPRKDVQEIIMRKLAELKEKEAKPSGSAEVRPNDNTARK